MKIKVESHPLAKILTECIEMVQARTNWREGVRWAFRTHPELGDRTPVNTLKAGDEELLRRFARDGKV